MSAVQIDEVQTRKRRRTEGAISDATFLNKIKLEEYQDPEGLWEHAAQLSLKPVQPRFLRLNDDGDLCYYMACVACKELKPALPSHFCSAKERNAICRAGNEVMHNSTTYPCLKCYACVALNDRQTEHGYILKIMCQYPRLKPLSKKYSCNGLGWYCEKVNEQGGECVIESGRYSTTRKPLCTVCFSQLTWGGRHVPFCASINNKNVANKGSVNHKPEDCELICASHNVAQQHEDIKDLKQCFAALVAATDAAEGPHAAVEEAEAVHLAELNWANRSDKAKNGILFPSKDAATYAKQCADLDLFTICNKAASYHRIRDLQKGRANDITTQDIYDLLISQRCRCHYTRGLLTIYNGPMRFSLERLDNSLGHIKGNCVLVSRMMNSPAVNSAKIYEAQRASYKAYHAAKTL